MQKEETGSQGSASTRIEPGYVLIGEPYVLHVYTSKAGGWISHSDSDTNDRAPEGVGVSDLIHFAWSVLTWIVHLLPEAFSRSGLGQLKKD